MAPSMPPGAGRAALMQAHKSGERGIITSLTFKLQPNAGCGRLRTRRHSLCAPARLNISWAKIEISPRCPVGNHSRQEREASGENQQGRGGGDDVGEWKDEEEEGAECPWINPHLAPR